MDSEIHHDSNTSEKIDETAAASISKRENTNSNKTTENLLDGEPKKILRNNDRKRKTEDEGYVWEIFLLSNSKFPANEIERVQIGVSFSSQHQAEKNLNKLRLIRLPSFIYRSETMCIGPSRESPHT